ncbi:glycosyltransferase family 4 protein [Verrucomicrobiota bacterium]
MYLLIGPYPPPLGGISVFIKRYQRALAVKDIPVEIVNFTAMTSIRKLGFMFKIVFSPYPYTFHLNAFYFLVMTALLLRPWRGRIIFHNHSTRTLDDFDAKRRMVFKWFIRKTDEIIFVGSHLVDDYKRHGFCLPDNITIKNSFLPPPSEDEPGIRQKHSNDTVDFVKNHKPLIIANASRLTFYKGVDLYGLDMCVELVAKLKPQFPGIGLLFALVEVQDEDYFERIKKRINELKISNNFYFMTGDYELWPLFKDADLMIRPTSSDGYGISVDEALSQGCPSIASDVCGRAEGAITFRSLDLADLHQKCTNVLADTALEDHHRSQQAGE